MLTSSLRVAHDHRPYATPEKLELTHCLRAADVEVDGERPWDIQVHDDRFYQQLWADGSAGLGDGYMRGWWDCEELDGMMCRILHSGLHRTIRGWTEFDLTLQAKTLGPQTTPRALEGGPRHYAVGNDLYHCMLDRRMIYTCAYWERARKLDDTQEAKLDLICRKLALEPGMRVLDIGCGWGGVAKFAAERYGVSVVAISNSQEHAVEARQTCQGLPIEIRLQDYRDIRGRFDRAYTIGTFEQLGSRNQRTYMEMVANCLEPEGLFLLHTIGSNLSGGSGNPWVEWRIFPDSILPSCRQIAAAAEGNLMIEDWHRFGSDYDTTLIHWWRNFDHYWDGLRSRYDERFYRMWRYYLLSFAGAFRARHNQLWQIVLSPMDARRSYQPVR